MDAEANDEAETTDGVVPQTGGSIVLWISRGRPTCVSAPVLAFCKPANGGLVFPLECDYGYSCLYDDVYSWFGCCTGTSITDCEVYTACVQSRSIDECVSNSACYNDDLAMIW